MTDTDLPARAGDIIKFTPTCAAKRDPAPVYLLRVPSISDRHAIERDIVAKGASFPDFGRSLANVRAGIRAVLPAERHDAALAIVSDFEGLAPVGEGKDFNTAYIAYVLLEEELKRHYTPVAIQVAQGQFYNATAQLTALRYLLTGWSKTGAAPEDFVREDGLTAEQSLALIPADEFAELALKAQGLVRLSQAKSKKSAPPVSSSSSPTDTQAAPATTEASGPNTGAASPSTT